jgi:glycosyltransferase involved in cell wall biosynthesis
MNILHYALGFPPFRTGGMIKYCMDLMSEEAKLKHWVGLLWPGRITDYSEKVKIIKNPQYVIDNEIKIKSFEIINPLPVPLLDGINDFEAYMRPKVIDNIEKFFISNKVDILHVHTLMGFPKEVLEVCFQLNIKTVFTTHDYFGICPRWSLERQGSLCLDDNGCESCIKCNKTALSLRKIKFMQSMVYRYLKNTPIMKSMRRMHNSQLYKEDYGSESDDCYSDDVKKRLSKRYRELRRYYTEMIESFNIIHCNSSNTSKIYNRYCNICDTVKVLNISHSAIKDFRKQKDVQIPVRFGYLGPITQHKGYFFIKQVFNELSNIRNNSFQLHIFSECMDEADYLIKHPAYDYSDLKNVMGKFDILLVPSLWNETFGFTVLEALSYGIPVIVTENVGAKDLIVPKMNGDIVAPDTESMKSAILDIIDNPEIINRMSKYILENTEIQDMSKHTLRMLELYTQEGNL